MFMAKARFPLAVLLALACKSQGFQYLQTTPSQRLVCNAEQYTQREKVGDVPDAAVCAQGVEHALFGLAHPGAWPFGKTFPLDASSWTAASIPHGHRGKRLRLSKAMLKLATNKPLTVAVLGGSMPNGHGCSVPWPRRLELLAKDLGHTVHVLNLAKAATTSKWAVSHIAVLRKRLTKADVVLVDYSINDRAIAWKADAGMYTGGRKEVQKSFRELLSLLIALPQKPAVVSIETVSEVHYHVPKCQDIDTSKWHHWDVSVSLAVPVFSYSDAMCKTGNLTWPWSGYREHPTDITHDLLARMVMAGFLLQAGEVCQKGVQGEDYESTTVSTASLCLSHPTVSMGVARSADDFATRPVEQGLAWHFEEDVPGKPGWIAKPGLPSTVLAFPITVSQGWIQVEFLGTYENIGSVDVWLDSDKGGCTLNGLWSDPSSQSRFSLMRWDAPVAQANKNTNTSHILRFGSRGSKFKLLGITAC